MDGKQPQNPKHRTTYRVFVSARYASRQRAADFVKKLCEHEAAVCPLQWFTHDRDDADLNAGEKLALSTSIVRAVAECDYFVHLHEPVPQRGGNLVELGMAIAYGKTIIAVLPHDVEPLRDGPLVLPPERKPRGGIFHELPQCYVVPDDEAALNAIHNWLDRKVDSSPASRGVHLQNVATLKPGFVPGDDKSLADCQRRGDFTGVPDPSFYTHEVLVKMAEPPCSQIENASLYSRWRMARSKAPF